MPLWVKTTHNRNSTSINKFYLEESRGGNGKDQKTMEPTSSQDNNKRMSASIINLSEEPAPIYHSPQKSKEKQGAGQVH